MDVLQCLNQKILPQGFNDTFLVLIPKTDNPTTLRQFRPISLCDVVYKTITKMIVNRLKPLLPKFISLMQTSFILRRNISDNIIIYQEVLHSFQRKKGLAGCMMVKIDLEKAYDRLEWGFVSTTLLHFGLPQHLIDVIMMCVTTPSFRILWNGEPTDQFIPSRGLRQGDPLSPYLFVLCLERLGHLIESKVAEGLWKPISVVRGGPKLSHLCFADDLILFAKAELSQAHLIRQVLNIFCADSGQKISFDKSHLLLSTNVRSQFGSSLSNVLHIPLATNLGKYLGVPSIKELPIVCMRQCWIASRRSYKVGRQDVYL